MNYFFSSNEASSDESGKGDFFGGICVCAVYINELFYLSLKKSNLLYQIKDSKKISDQNIEVLAPKLLSLLKDNVYVVKFSAQEYNYEYSKIKNLNILLAKLHNRAWENLNKKLNNIEIKKKIIDAFCTSEQYLKYLESINETPFNVNYFEQKAESKYISCAIASIIARYFFLKEIQDISNIFNSCIPKGNSYNKNNSVVDAYKLIQKKYKNIQINNYCKNHFKTMEKIK